MLPEYLQTLNHYLTLAGLPSQYIWVGPVVIFLFSIALMFAGEKAWRFMIGIIGALLGYLLFSHYILSDPTLASYLSGVPPLLITLIVSVASAILFGIFVRFFLSAIIGYGAYLGASYFQPQILSLVGTHWTYAPIYLMIAIGVIAGAIAYALYRKLTILIAAAIGAIGVWYTLVLAGISAENSIYVAVLFMAVGLYLQTNHYEMFKKKKHEKTSDS